MIKLTPTIPIENIVDASNFALTYSTFCQSLGFPRNLVKIHKTKLGRQTQTIQGSAHRLWVWDRKQYVVFVSNAKGICFEVPENASEKQAMAAWKQYVKDM